MKKKKIILAVTNDLSYDQRMQRICRSLCAGGYEVELVGRQRSASVPLRQESFVQTRLSCFFESGKLFYAVYNIRLFFYLLFSRFDALCAVDLDTIIPIYLAGSIKKSFLVYDAHEYFTEVPEVVRRKTIQSVWQAIERTFVPRFQLAYTVSEGIARLFEARYPLKFQIIRNLPYRQNTPPKPSERKAERFLLYQGALNEGRGLEHLLAAMPELDCRLKLAGEGDLSETLRRQVAALHLETKVQFLGYMPPDKLALLTREAYLGINLLENKGLSYYYSLANKFFDYIQAGVPQVCIGFPEYQRLNEQWAVALLLHTPATDEIKAAVQRLLSDNSLYSQLHRNCVQAAEELNWEKEEQKLLSLYHGLLG